MQGIATEKQVGFIGRLYAEKKGAVEAGSLVAEYAGQIESGRLAVDKATASGIIEQLLALPRPVVKQATVESDVSEGRYAVEIGGHVHFFRVDRPTSGKWAGWTFVKRQYGDNYDRVRGAEAEQVLALIARDPDAALRRYGQELGVCGVCGRSLTDAESRDRGIGPECNRRREVAA